MSNPIITMLPFAVGAMISPFVLIVQALILASGIQPKLRGWLYTLGCTAFTIVFIVAVYAGLSRVAPGNTAPSPVLRAIEITIGILLLVLTVRVLLDKHRPRNDHETRMQHMVQTAKPRSFFIVGLAVMATDLSSLIILVPGVRAVQETQAAFALQAIALIIALVFTLMPALLPVALATLFGRRADHFLKALNHFVTKNSRFITAGICVLLAVLLFVGALR
ncbi:MAG: hypothetical protein FJW80_00760 [Actinobacteria bacterium]|nr:hypothetical protein [Actinomycetota bacterium]